MKSKFILFRQAGVFYSEDTTTGKQHSLRTKDEAEALASSIPRTRPTASPCLAGATMHITQHKQGEEALPESEERFRAVANSRR